MINKEKTFPEKAVTAKELIDQLTVHKSHDARWDEGKVFGFVYHPGKQKADIAEKYYNAFLYESTLNPAISPSLTYFEKDVIRMAAELMHGNKSICGSITSGGTESIFLAVKVARDLAAEKKRGTSGWEVILPETAHPAFLKACQYLCIKPLIIPVSDDKRASVGAIRAAINRRTILIACSAPCYPYGVVDPISRIGSIAKKHHLPFHVDACMGGFMLPHLEDLGFTIPVFDFRVPGVTSISLDAHKYGYAPKGSSIILYRHRNFRRKQFFVNTDWPGGIFASTTFMGTKSGGPMAGTWAIMKHLGREGYREIARNVMRTTLKIREGIQKIEGLKIVGDPDMSILSFTSENNDIFNVGDALMAKGWYLDRLQFPDCLHLTITQLNTGKEEEFLRDLREIMSGHSELVKQYKSTNIAIKVTRGLTKILPSSVFQHLTRQAGKNMKSSVNNSKISQAALYGISSSFKNRRNVYKLVENLLDGMFS